MDEVGFNTQATFSTSQLGGLFVFVLICIAALFFLKRYKDALPAWLSTLKKNESIAKVSKQAIDASAALYKIETSEHCYLVFKSADSITVLDKSVGNNDLNSNKT